MCLLYKKKIYDTLITAAKNGDTSTVEELHKRYPLRLRWIRYACITAVIFHRHDVFDFLFRLLDSGPEIDTHIMLYQAAIVNGNEHAFDILIDYRDIADTSIGWYWPGFGKYSDLVLRMLNAMTNRFEINRIFYTIFQEGYINSVRAIICAGHVSTETANIAAGTFMYRRNMLEILQETGVNLSFDMIIANMTNVNKEGTCILFKLTSIGHGADQRKQLLYERIKMLYQIEFVFSRLSDAVIDSLEEILQGFPPIIGDSKYNILGGNKSYRNIRDIGDNAPKCDIYKDIVIITTL